MNDRINYGTAVYAAAKGFDWPTDELYLPHNIDVYAEGRWCNWNHEEYYENEEDGHPISRPRQSELQAWLRMVYKIDVFVLGTTNSETNPTIDNYYCEYHIGVKDFETESFDSYEKALEEGLQKALKLI